MCDGDLRELTGGESLTYRSILLLLLSLLGVVDGTLACVISH